MPVPPPTCPPSCFSIAEVAGIGIRCIAFPQDPAFVEAFRAFCKQHGLREMSTQHFIKKTD